MGKNSDGKSQCSDGQGPTRRRFQRKFHADERGRSGFAVEWLFRKSGRLSVARDQLAALAQCSPIRFLSFSLTSGVGNNAGQLPSRYEPATEFIGTVTWNNGADGWCKDRAAVCPSLHISSGGLLRCTLE